MTVTEIHEYQGVDGWGNPVTIVTPTQPKDGEIISGLALSRSTARVIVNGKPCQADLVPVEVRIARMPERTGPARFRVMPVRQGGCPDTD